MNATCDTCQFKHVLPYKTPEAEGVNLFCRRHPPTLMPSGTQSALVPIGLDGWCGEYERAKIKKSATKSVPAPGSDPDAERSSNLSVPNKPKKGINAII